MISQRWLQSVEETVKRVCDWVASNDDPIARIEDTVEWGALQTNLVYIIQLCQRNCPKMKEQDREVCIVTFTFLRICEVFKNCLGFIGISAGIVVSVVRNFDDSAAQIQGFTQRISSWYALQTVLLNARARVSLARKWLYSLSRFSVQGADQVSAEQHDGIHRRSCHPRKNYEGNIF